MPSFLSRHGSNRLRKPRKTGDEGAIGRTGTGTGTGIGGVGGGAGGGMGGGGGGGGVVGVGNARGDPKSSLVLFTAVSNSSSANSHSSASVNKLQRSESSKRRFGFSTILTRGKNRTDIGQGIVSSKIGDMRHQTAGSRPAAGEPGAGSKDGILPVASQQQQPSAPIVQPVQNTPEKSLSPPNTTYNTNNSPTRVIAPVLSLRPAVSPVISSPAEFSSQPQNHSMAATATMTSVMQRPSLSLALSVPQAPPFPSNISQRSGFNSSFPLPPSLPDNDKSTSMLNTIDTYSPLLSSPVVANATAISFSRPALVDGRLHIGHHGTLNNTIDTPLGYYITPSQTPTLVDRPDTHFSPRPVPTVMRPGPSTPPLTESSVSLSLSVAKIALPTAPETHLQLANIPSIPIPIPGDRPFNNGPPTPTSSDSSQKDRDPNRHVNFLQENGTPTSSIRSVGGGGGNAGNMYPNPSPQPNRFNNRPPGRPRGNHPRPNQPPLRGHPRRMPIRGPPRPPSPIYMPPADMKDHIWMPFKSNQLECSMGHSLVPFRNKQHSIPCTVCRSIEFEGRGEPVKRSYYCAWCAVRMCGGCKEELGICQGKLAELWDRTEEKRSKNMVMIKDGTRPTKIEKVAPEVQNSNNESLEPGWTATTGPVDEQAQGKISQKILGVDMEGPPFPGQRTPPRGQPQRQLVIPQPQQSISQPRQSIPRPQQSIPQPQQSIYQAHQSIYQPQQSISQPQQSIPQPQQSIYQAHQSIYQPQQSIYQSQQSIYQPQKSIPRPQQSYTQQPQQSRVYQTPSDGERVPQQPRQSSQGPPLPEKPGSYLPALRQTAPLNIFPARLPQQVPQLTPAETQKYRLVSVPTDQKPPQSSTVVLVGEKPKDSGTFPASLKGSVTKKRNWFRNFGKKKEV